MTGIRCPECGGRVDIIDSRSYNEDARVVRQRRCRDCDLACTTIEDIVWPTTPRYTRRNAKRKAHD